MEDALMKHIKARIRAYETNNLSEAASLSNIIGVHYSEKGEYEKALYYHKEELQLSESLKDNLGQAVAHRKIGEALGDMGQFVAALDEQDQYLKMAVSLSNLQEIQRAHATLGRIWYLKYKDDELDIESLDKAKLSYCLSLDTCDELERLGSVVTMRELSDMKARIYLNLGLLAEETNDSDLAQDNYEKACKIGKEFNVNDVLLWQCHFNYGELLMNVSESNKALIVFEESLQYASKHPQNKSLSLTQMAMINIDMLSWITAKKHLKLCVKLSTLLPDHDDDQVQGIIRKYRAVCKIIQLLKRIESTVSHEEKINILERMADICCCKDILFYTAAIRFYSWELELAEAHGMDSKRISSVLFSLAETHCDREEYKQALQYYERELTIWADHPIEAASSWCNIASVYEAMGREWSVVMETYHKAIDLAKTSSDVVTLRDVYQSTITYLDECNEGGVATSNEGGVATSIQLKQELQLLYQNNPQLKEADNNSSPPHVLIDSQDVIDNEELVISCSSSEDEEDLTANVPSTRQLRGVALRKKSTISKKNEKGETLLHVATIDGNLNRVKQLINEGAEVNTRDYCGWTPLHEACNHGYTDIASLLVENKANINDSGGDHCHQTTPLMDAAINGYADIVQYLINEGAELMRTNDKSETVLAIINRSISEGSSSKTLYKEHKEVRTILMKEMSNQGLNICHQSQPTSHRTGHVTPPVAIVYPLQSQQSQPALIEADSIEWAESEGSPLLPSHDNWLIEDMEPPKKKKRESNNNQVGVVKNRRTNQVGVANNRRTNQVGVANNRRMNRTKSLVRQSDNIIMITDCDNGDTGDDDSYHAIDDIGSISNYGDISGNYGDIGDSDRPQCLPSVQDGSTHFINDTLRLNVCVEGVTYLVPCSHYHDNQPLTVASLTDKVCDRYVMLNGRRPVLNLTTKDGALLCPTDNIMDVVQEGESLVGVVSHWDTLLFTEHYQSVCKKFKTTPNDKVIQAFQSNVNPLTAELSNCGLRPSDSPPLFQSLLSQYSITTLLLSGNNLRDASMVNVSLILKSLPNVFTLNISCIDITCNGIQLLSQSLIGQNLPLHNLIVSHNSLGPSCGFALAQLLSVCPQLISLDLSDIGMTSYTLEHHTGLIDRLTSLTRLHTLSLAYNDIGCDGINAIITATASLISLRSINLGNTSEFLSVSLLSKHILSLASLTILNLTGCQLGSMEEVCKQSLDNCQLQEITLSRTQLTLESVQRLSWYFKSCPLLRRVDLSGNPLLAVDGVMTVLSNCQPSELSLQNCGLKSPLPLQLYSKESRTYIDLSDNNEITINDRNIIIDHWAIISPLVGGNVFIVK